jgi:TetR/AcrR family transcriptional regulator, transcriptional repressor for nem operon
MASSPSTRDGLVAAARELLWERGYESTSPKAIMQASGAGQGSFYHHFRSKRDLAAAALEEVADDLISGLEGVFDPRKPALARVEDWLLLPRNALAGCRLGRMALEKSVLEDDVLRRPVVRYFKAAEKHLRAAVTEAQQRGEISGKVDCDDLASMLLTVIQGGYLVSRAHRDPDKLGKAVRAAVSLLTLHRTRT